MGNDCRALRESDPINFPSDIQLHYKPKTSNWSLRAHIERLHLIEYLELAKENDWEIFLNKVTVVLDMGYDVPTLLERLRKPGATLHNLPPPPGRRTNNRQGDLPPDGDSPGNELPPFSTAAFHRFLVKFITADDQVCISGVVHSAVHVISDFFLLVHQRHRMP